MKLKQFSPFDFIVEIGYKIVYIPLSVIVFIINSVNGILDRVQEIQDWMNNYPRKILAYKTPKQVAAEYLRCNSFDQEFKFCRS